MADWDLDFIVAPETVNVHIMMMEAVVCIHSLKLLNTSYQFSGLASWIMETVEAMDKDRLRINQVLLDMADHITPVYEALARRQNLSFQGLIQEIGHIDSSEFVDCTLDWVRKKADYMGDDVLLGSKETYVKQMRQLLAHKVEKGYDFDEDVWALRYEYLIDPERMRSDLVDHLQYMWDNYLKAEWKRVRATLEEVVDAFAGVEFTNMTAFDVIEAITGRNMRGSDSFDEAFQQVDSLVFIPSPHLGPYIGWGPSAKETEVVFFFGARLPKNTNIKSIALSRNELLVRLSALADETRLKILELLTQHHELCAQDFITSLDLSQSSASRHLRQLTASGYISERRRDVAKCYTLNPDRIDDTIRALRDFLRKE